MKSVQITIDEDTLTGALHGNAQITIGVTPRSWIAVDTRDSVCNSVGCKVVTSWYTSVRNP